MEKGTLKTEKRDAKKAARQLGYGLDVIHKIDNCVNVYQIDNIMATARRSM